jgi:TrmH family RNA methyltransferase
MSIKKFLDNDLVLIEGAKDVFEILNEDSFDNNFVNFIEKILWHKTAENLKEFKAIQNLAFERNIDFTEIHYAEFKNLRNTVHSNGIFAVVKKIEFDIEETLKKSKFVIVLDNIQDPGNFGTIIRTASILGVDAVITINNSVRLNNPKALRAVKGYFNKFPILENIDFSSLMDIAKKFKFNFFSADMVGESIYDDNLKLEKPLCLFFGSEGQGLSELVDNNIQKICIPMKDTDSKNNKKSLNVAISVGIMISEVNRRWK